MKFNFIENNSGTGSELGKLIYVPLFFILMLVASVDSLQSFFIYYKGAHTFENFTRFFAIKSIYSLHFLLLAFVIQFISSKIKTNKKSIPIWIAINLTAMIFMLVVHQTVFMMFNYLIWNGVNSKSLYDLIFDNPLAWLDIAGYVLFTLGYYYIKYRRITYENEIKLSNLEVELLRSKLNELRNRIHPQFLFNSLNTISELIKNCRNKEANRILSLLSDFLRITVYDNERDIISLGEEIGCLEKYMEIEKVNFNKDIRVIKEYDKDILSAAIPNFILQPLLENIIYGIKDLKCKNISIKITATRKANQLELIVGVSAEAGKEPALIEGADSDVLNITRERLLHLYGGEQELSEAKNKCGNAELKILIPYSRMKYEHEFKYETERA